jgi:hypothetical protein
MDNRAVYHFHGMTVIVPDQDLIQVRPIDKGIPEPFLYGAKYPLLIRIIANLQFVDRSAYESGSVIPVSTFSPFMELRVGYHFLDVMRCGGDYQNLKLAYWFGNEWVPISDPAHDYLILPPSLGQVAEVKIGSWPADPPLAWVT